jgi:hypothetical protein
LQEEEAQPQALPPVSEQQPAPPVWPPQVLPFPLQEPAQWEPQALEAQPRAPPVQQPGAFAPLSRPRLLRLCPPWLLLLPLLPRPLLPEYVCAPSPQHPREWNSSASSFP